MKNTTTIKTILTLATLLSFVSCGSSTASSGNVQANSTHAYISNGTSLKIVDITSPATPLSKGSITLGSARFVSVIDDIAYVGEYASSDPYVSIVNTSDKTAPVLAAAIPKSNPLGLVTDMYIENSIAFTTDEYHGLHVIDIPNTSFQQQATFGADAMSVTKLNSHMYTIEQGASAGMVKYDVSTATSPTLLTQVSDPNLIDTSSYPNATSTNSHHSWLEQDGTNLYLANVKFRNFIKFDTTLTEVARVTTGGSVTALAILGQYAYITMANSSIPLTGGYDGIKMIDLSSMTVVSSQALVQASGVAVQDDHVYVTDSTGLHIYNVSSGSLSLVTTLPAGNGNFISLGK